VLNAKWGNMQQGHGEDDQDIERYLKKFQLRAVRPLKMPRPTGSPQMRWLVAAAALVVCAGGAALWLGKSQTIRSADLRAASHVRSTELRPQRPFNSPALTKLALDDSKAFDAVLTDKARTMFPDMQGERSALRVLAKE
jgi:capsular polysaccharide biosynthesis protein